MTRIRRSRLFKTQLLNMTAQYRAHASADVAMQFVDQIEACVDFIAKRPKACAVYTELQGKIFRKWRLSSFPVSVFFRMEDEDIIILEAIYAHRMNIAARLPDETKDDI